jgi:hypothetical protein
MHSKLMAKILLISVALMVLAILSPRVANGDLSAETLVKLEGVVIVDTPTPVVLEFGNKNPEADITLNFMVLSNVGCSLELDSYLVSIPKGSSQLVEVTYVASQAGLCSGTILIYWYDGIGGSGWHTITIEAESRDGNVAQTIVVDGLDTGIKDREWGDQLVSEYISECAVNAKNHGAFVSCVAKLTNELRKSELITNKEKEIIQNVAAQAKIP